MDGDVADQSTMENKILHDDVPQRYKNIKLMPDWYAGPGKRKKRKHRKQHGKIGFLELSKIISTRWAELGQVDPETKSFVQKIAKSEVAEYYKEMDQYKELIKDLPASALPPKKTNKKRTVQQQQQQQMPVGSQMISSYPSSMPPHMSAQLTQDINYLLSQIDNNKTQTMLSSQYTNNSFPPQAFSFEQQGSSKKMKTCHPQVQQEEENTPLTSKPIIATPMMNKRVMMTRQVSDRSIIEAYDSFKNDQPLNIDDIICQPIDTTNDDPAPLKRTISNGSSCGSPSYPDDVLTSPSSVEVDLCDDEILQLWATSY